MTDPSSGRRPGPPRLADFPHRLDQNIRIKDLDRHGHVNNAVFVTFFECGRVVLLYDPRSLLQVPGTTFVLANLTIDYLGPMHWPGDVTVGTALARLGRSSVTFDQALFIGDTCTAYGKTTVVLVDAETRKAREFPPDVAARLRASAPRVPMKDEPAGTPSEG